jgi:alpha-glucosidase
MGVIYQIYPRSFKDTNGDGIGDLQGIIEKLDYLNDGTPNSLGVDAIWICPFYPSPMADFGYDVSDYCDVDPLFGNLTTFDRLVREAHQRNIRVIIDYVPNHTSDQHPWFLESRSSRHNPKRDWYIWRDPKPGGLPNNWGGVFGGPAWEWDERTGQYYFHQFLKEQPDLNWRNPEVRAAMLDVLRFWLERGVDGFRMDVVGMIFKHPDMPDQPPAPQWPSSPRPNDFYARQAHLYDQDQDEVYEMTREFRRFVEAHGDKCLIGEILWHDMPRWVRYYGRNGDGLHLPFYFRLLETPWEAGAVRRAVDELEAAIPPFAWPNHVLGNHDRDRLASRCGPEQTRVAAMLLLTLRGTPTLYYGDEIGLESGDIPPDKAQDPWGVSIGPERNRDRCRTPMQWDDGPHAGFAVGEPWLPVSTDYRQRNVAVQGADPASLLNLYRRLLWYRRHSLALQSGAYSPLPSEQGCYAYQRKLGTEQKLVALNFTNREKSVTLSRSGLLAISTYLDRGGEASGPQISLRPHEGVIVELSPEA